jgi:hypothetical protein
MSAPVVLVDKGAVPDFFEDFLRPPTAFGLVNIEAANDRAQPGA